MYVICKGGRICLFAQAEPALILLTIFDFVVVTFLVEVKVRKGTSATAEGGREDAQPCDEGRGGSGGLQGPAGGGGRGRMWMMRGRGRGQ